MRTDLNACRLSVNDTLSVVKDFFAQYFWSLQKIVVENPRFPNNQVYRHTHTHTHRQSENCCGYESAYNPSLQIGTSCREVRRHWTDVSETIQGCARFAEFLQNFSECQILWSLCSVVFHAFTLRLPIKTSLSVAPKLQVCVRSDEKCQKFKKTSTSQVSVNDMLYVVKDFFAQYC